MPQLAGRKGSSTDTEAMNASRKMDFGVQPLTLLSSFFIVTRSRDLRECPVGVMK